MNRALEYSDILIVPQKSDIRSRDEVDVSVTMAGIRFNSPILVAPMDSIATREFLIVLSDAGGFGFIHRFQSNEERLDQMMDLHSRGFQFGVSVGLLDSDQESNIALEAAKYATIVCIDVANGHNTHTIKSAESLVKSCEKLDLPARIMTGNIATVGGYEALNNVRVDFVRAGIGSGSACTTRNMTGIGVPQATLINGLDVFRNTIQGIKSTLVADGGIKYPGDILKALGIGADMVMSGYLFSGAKESNGGIYRGMASKSAQEDQYGFVRSVEGIEIESLNHGESVGDIYEGIINNLKSGMSYLGVTNIADIRNKATTIIVGSSAIKEL